MKGLAYEEELNKLGAHLLQFTTMLCLPVYQEKFPSKSSLINDRAVEVFVLSEL